MTHEHRKELLDVIAALRLIDDTFFHACLADNVEGMEYILRIILDRPQLVVREMQTQEDVPNLYGRAVRFDVFATDADGTEYDIEVQRSDGGADPHRARFNASMMDTMHVEKGAEWKQLPKVVVIFITETDVLKGGKPLYHVERVIREMDCTRFEDDAEILYVNGTFQDDTPLGKLMQDFFCKEPSKMHSKVLAERASFFKSDEHGVMTMSKVMEDFAKKYAIKYAAGERAEGKAEGIAQGIAEKTLRTIRNQLKRHVAYADIASDNETTVDEVIRIAKESNLSY
ncbi:MAG: PD-(D/E)XK nuclease family transposase [Selenomonas sp.]|nr:PD-(D/E)XK nuclease family transposase [Selenomonas sp.]